MEIVRAAAEDRDDGVGERLSAVRVADAGVPPVELLDRRLVAREGRAVRLRLREAELVEEEVGSAARLMPRLTLDRKADEVVVLAAVRPVESEKNEGWREIRTEIHF